MRNLGRSPPERTGNFVSVASDWLAGILRDRNSPPRSLSMIRTVRGLISIVQAILLATELAATFISLDESITRSRFRDFVLNQERLRQLSTRILMCLSR